MRIPLSRPVIEEVDRAAVLEVLSGSTLALGPHTRSLEEAFAARLGAPCVLVSSGTAALYLALRALGVDGGEVITPSYGFVATAHAIRLAGATPRFIDVDPAHGCITLSLVEDAATNALRAIIPVHLFGTPAPVAPIAEWGAERAIPVIEDACEALGTICGGRPAGTLGDAGTLAFYPNKQMTLGEGGLVILRDEEAAERVRSMRNQGRAAGRMQFAGEGFNFRVTEMQAALGSAQLARVDRWNARRSAIARAYTRDFSTHRAVETWAELPAAGEERVARDPVGDVRSWFTFPIFLRSEETRDRLAAALAERGIETAPYFPAVDRFPPYDRAPRTPDDLPVTRSLSARGLALPFHPGLTEEERREVVASVVELLPSA